MDELKAGILGKLGHYIDECRRKEFTSIRFRLFTGVADKEALELDSQNDSGNYMSFRDFLLAMGFHEGDPELWEEMGLYSKVYIQNIYPDGSKLSK